MARTAIDRQKDNLANRINKRMQRAKQDLGRSSALYGRMTSVTRMLDRKFLTKDFQIGRGVALNDVDIEDLRKILDAFNTSPELNIIEEKRKLQAIVSTMNPNKNAKNTRLGDYRKAEKYIRNLGDVASEAIDYFYNYVADTDPEKADFNAIMSKKHKTYSDMSRIQMLAKHHYERVAGFDSRHDDFKFNTFTSFIFTDREGNEL